MSRLNVCQRLRIFGSTNLEVPSIAVPFFDCSTTADTGPEENKENSFAAPERSKEPEENTTHHSETAGPRRVGTVFPSVLQEVIPELRVWTPGSVAGHLPGARALPAHIQILVHIIC